MKIKRPKYTGIPSKINVCQDSDIHEEPHGYPLISDLFSVEKLKKHGESMAHAHCIDYRSSEDPLLPRLSLNEKTLKEIFVLLTDEESSKQTIPSAGIWLLDNYYLISEQILTARSHLPKRYSRELPKLGTGPAAGLPRVYDIVQELISHVDGRIDAGNLNSIVEGYQSVTALKLGELWAIPIMLRLALIDNLRRVAERILGSWIESKLARTWAERMLADAVDDPGKIIIDMADMERADIRLSGAFVSEFARKLRSQNTEMNLPLVWLEQRLTRNGTSIENKIRTENRHQAVNQISVSNTISSLRFLMTVDWKNFVESNSAVEAELLKDPADQYGKMDFATRDAYRHEVERLARKSGLPEESVAAEAVKCAADSGRVGREKHVGYFLIDLGAPVLETKLKIHGSYKHIIAKTAVPLYVWAIVFVSAGLCVPAIYLFPPENIIRAITSSIILLICFSRLSVYLVNRLVARIITPKTLPRMDFSGGIPDDMKTLITVPSIISDESEVKKLLNKMEVCYLSNNDRNMLFSLLTDFTDAPREHMPADDDLLRSVQNGIRDLNARYGTEGNAPFLLFHRTRRWNARDRIWMGYERKRGKLEALNEFIRQPSSDIFRTEGNIDAVIGIRYVITLDTDTQLPTNSARHLVETMAHPLNRPVYDSSRGIVTDGYTIMQPRVVSGHPSSETSWYAKLFGSDSGIDPYTRAVSDVYQDLAREGSFIGKGIYDVEMFRRVMSGRFPDNRILSHDLLEGNYSRSALVTDIQFVDDFPDHYHDDAERRHRWIRGDWQIASWILPIVPDAKRKFSRNRLSLLSKWKIFDNLRRSAVSPALMCLILPPFFLITPSWAGLALAAFIWYFPAIIETVSGLSHKPEKYPPRLHLYHSALTSIRHIAALTVEFILLPHDAYLNINACARTIWRLIITRRKRLEWKSYRDSVLSSGKGLIANIAFMWIVPATMTVLLILLFMRNGAPQAGYAVPVIWFFSPAVAWMTGRPRPRKREILSSQQRIFLRKLSRRTWRYFETFAGADNNWIPADNYQEEPVEATARRTSPTNIGLMLLSDLGAYDLGYISQGQMIESVERSFKTLSKLERFRGHFFNWYDTATLMPLPPAYVSTVDSGNMSGYLLTLRRGLLNTGGCSVYPESFPRGLEDTIHVLAERIIPRSDLITSLFVPISPAEDCLHSVGENILAIKTDISSLSSIITHLDTLIGLSADLRMYCDDDPETRWWRDAFEKQCRSQKEDLLFIAPWFAIPDFGGLPESTRVILDSNMTLRGLADIDASSLIAGIPAEIRAIPDEPASYEGKNSANIGYHIRQGIHRADERVRRIEKMASQCRKFADIDYSFLYDESRRLLAIGYDTVSHRRDEGFYDLLASEARLGSFVGIAQGKLPVEHWFSLGRLVTVQNGGTALLSWGGSMFEYLMPQLVLPSYRKTLLDETCRSVIDCQMRYGLQRGDFWGISESAENITDAGLNYQYRSFGVPSLGFRRGLANDLVIAPYASVLALAYSPRAACANLRKMADRGFWGRFGFYEAIDYTTSRRGPDGTAALIKSFMSHHQGMSFLALVNFFTNNVMIRRFESDPLFRTASLLLQEKVPRTAPFSLPPSDMFSSREAPEISENTFRAYTTPHTTYPEIHLLSNGRYHVMITNAGGGYSRWRDISVTRWTGDPTRDNEGSFIYINDLTSDTVLSCAHQPVRHEAKKYEAIFLQGRAEFRRGDSGLDTYTEIAVSPEEDVEYRRITITNVSLRTRTVELTSYQEIDLLPPSASIQHPAFSNLFVRTKIVRHQRAVCATRRPRSPVEKNPHMFHLLSLDKSDNTPDVSYETDRMKFIGRGRTTEHPAALDNENRGPLSCTEGSILDAVASIRCTLTLKPGESAVLGFVTGMCETENEALALIEKYQDRRLADRVFELAMVHDRVRLRQQNITNADIQSYDSLAGAILYPNPSYRAAPSVLMKNSRGQSALWAYSISGDLPVVLLRIGDESKLALAAQLIRAHEYWRRKGIQVDLVIWNENYSGYRQTLNDSIMALIAGEPSSTTYDKPGGIFIKHPDQMTEEDRILMLTVARVIITDGGGNLSEQIRPTTYSAPALRHHRAGSVTGEEPEKENFPQPDLIFHNGFGGFTGDGREYIIHLKGKTQTPMPWANVIANRRIGTVISQGGAYTWYENAHEFRLTPWYNDAVTDASGETLYLKDRITGEFWSPTPLPSPGPDDYLNRHGFGYSVFEYLNLGIKSELWMYTDTEDPVKFWLLKLRNDSSARRSLSASMLLEIVLGDFPSKTRMYVRTGIDPVTGSLTAVNPYATDFPGRVMFLESTESDRSVSGDRTEFIGRNGTRADPAAMYVSRLSGKVGDGLDPAAGMQVYFDLEPGQEKDVVFVLGVGRDSDEARILSLRYRNTLAAYQARDRVWDFWKRTLSAITVRTPDTSLNHIANGWLVYQVLSSRILARSGYYQSGGAFGFRDQLQDVMSLVYSRPDFAREQILLCASKQFPDGDVLHWWHPPLGRGVRTRISDDYLWLPFATAFYVKRTGDTGVLDEQVGFLSGRPLSDGEESYYDMPGQSELIETLYEHCVRAITRAMRSGAHGLPLMGSGDWNDGMNLVGIEGKGESVWLGFFLYSVLSEFRDIMRIRGDIPFMEKCSSYAAELRENISESSWDGKWFLRGFFDDGSPLGSSQNSECRIDSISQSWAALSGAASSERISAALSSLESNLVDPQHGIIRLLDPPFDTSFPDPGYIKGYPPGIRENGGQYTHAAVWTAMAFARHSDTGKIGALLAMLNPVNHGSTPEGIGKYKVEPYVMAADIYGAEPYQGRGGWTWYTGSASWMYRLIIESVFGINIEAGRMTFLPCLPDGWKECEIHYRYRETVYHITFDRICSGAAIEVIADDVPQNDFSVTLSDDRNDHHIRVHIGNAAGDAASPDM